MAVRPGVMLFDEPLSNLDAKLRDQVRMEIRSLQKAHGFTALYVTHDQSEALAMSDIVVVMNVGAIEQIGTPQDVYHRPVNRFVADFVGTANIVPARVMGSDPATKTWRISTPIGEATIASDQPPIADDVYVCWRPEDMEPANQGASTNIFSLAVRSKTFLGNLTDVGLVPPEGHTAPIRAQTLGFAEFVEGEIYKFRVSPNKLRFLQERVA